MGNIDLCCSMSRGLLPEMLQCTDMTVLERQRGRMKWQEEEEEEEEDGGVGRYFSELSGVFSGASQVESFQGGIIGSVKPDPGMENGWPDLGKIVVPGFGFGPSGHNTSFEPNFCISRTASCPPLVAATVAAELKKGKESVVLNANSKLSTASGRESFKKRKADKLHQQQNHTKVCVSVSFSFFLCFALFQ